tara:strand:- start:22 stop:519 length:498 start_codon:yes stop_codon:yes gene_type:complete
MIKDKKIKGGNILYKFFKTIEDIIKWIVNTIKWLFSPIFWFTNYLISWFFKSDGAMPCTWSHLYYIAFILAIILFIIENSIILIVRGSTDTLLKKLNMSSFNINYWINFPQFYIVFLYLTLLYKFLNGTLSSVYYYILLIVLILLFQKGLLLQLIYYLTNIWIKI